MRKILFLSLCLFSAWAGLAQELNFTVRINTQKLQTVDPKVFQTLEQTIQEFLNSQKWTQDVFETEERIDCNLLLTIQKELSPTSFEADLAIQSSRPVYDSDYETPILNHIDKGVTFFYEQFQPLEFSRNRYNDNLSAVLSYYVYVILGMDYDTFSPLGGEEFFQTAQEILNSVPQSAAASNPGWRSIESNRNRFWIIENLLSPRVRPLRQAMYNYHRQGLDVMAEDVATGRAVMAQALDDIARVDQAYPNSMIIQMFVNAKSLEMVEIFKRGNFDEQNRVIAALTQIDPTNAARYRGIK